MSHPVTEQEAARSILVQGLPLLDQELTESSIVQASANEAILSHSRSNRSQDIWCFEAEGKELTIRLLETYCWSMMMINPIECQLVVPIYALF